MNDDGGFSEATWAQSTVAHPPTRVGYALRVLFRRGRTFNDYVLFQPDADSRDGADAPAGGEAEVLSHSAIHLDSEFGPVLVIDRVLPTRLEDPSAWITLSVRDAVPGARTQDPRRDPMPDVEFWHLIDVLRGRVDHEGLSALIEALSRLPYLKVEAFRDALWEKLHALDHPRNTVRTGEVADGFVSADASLYFRCEIVASGETRYRSAIAQPTPGRDDDGASGQGLLSVADDSTRFALRPPQTDIDTGRNLLYWPDARPPVEPWMSLPSLSPFSSRVLHFERTVEDETVQRLQFTSFVAYATTLDGRVRELMGCLMAASFANARLEIVSFLATKLASDERLDDRIVVWQSGAAGVMPGVSMTGLSRKSSHSMREFIDLYYSGQLDSTS